jgi:hypothetical protein
VAKLPRLTHKIVIQLHLVAKSSTICSSHSRRPVQKLTDTPSYVPKKYKCFGIKIYKLYDTTSCTYIIIVYLGKDRQNVTQMMTATCVAVRSLTRRVEGVDHKLYMDNLFSFSDMTTHTRGINCQTIS